MAEAIEPLERDAARERYEMTRPGVAVKFSATKGNALDFTAAAVAVAAGIEPLEIRAARERMLAGKPCEKFTQGTGKSLDFTAAAVGMSIAVSFFSTTVL